MDEQVYAVLVKSARTYSTTDLDILVDSSPLMGFWLERGQPIPEPGSIIKVRLTNKRVTRTSTPIFYYEIVQ
jgi:hypothetical protein